MQCFVYCHNCSLACVSGNHNKDHIQIWKRLIRTRSDLEVWHSILRIKFRNKDREILELYCLSSMECHYLHFDRTAWSLRNLGHALIDDFSGNPRPAHLWKANQWDLGILAIYFQRAHGLTVPLPFDDSYRLQPHALQNVYRVGPYWRSLYLDHSELLEVFLSYRERSEINVQEANSLEEEGGSQQGERSRWGTEAKRCNNTVAACRGDEFKRYSFLVQRRPLK